MTEFIMWYKSESHGKDRFFVGLGKTPCPVHGFHPKPTWDYDKSNATILSEQEAQTAKVFAEGCGYKNLILEPIDEQPLKADPQHEKVPEAPMGAL